MGEIEEKTEGSFDSPGQIASLHKYLTICGEERKEREAVHRGSDGE